MEVLSGALIVAVFLVYLGFLHLLRHQRRVLIHRERLAALEKGTELPPVEQETQRRSWNVQLILLLAGLIWVGIGISAFVVLSVVLSYPPSALTADIPRGVEWVGLLPIAIGVPHLIVYAVARKQR